MRAIRPAELAATGLQGRRVRQRGNLRAEIRAMLTPPTARHRVTFIPLDKYTLLPE
jgi:hypothetical protein